MTKLRDAAQQARARKALDRKRKTEGGPARPEYPGPDEGMQPIGNERETPSGAPGQADPFPATQPANHARR